MYYRYILTTRGLSQMIEKYQAGDFGSCPRVFCEKQKVLPVGLTDQPGEEMVKLYCPKCRDVYTPKSSRHHQLDGAFFGSAFPHMFLMMNPEYRPRRPKKHFVARIFGFLIHPSAYQIQQDAGDLIKELR